MNTTNQHNLYSIELNPSEMENIVLSASFKVNEDIYEIYINHGTSLTIKTEYKTNNITNTIITRYQIPHCLDFNFKNPQKFINKFKMHLLLQ